MEICRVRKQVGQGMERQGNEKERQLVRQGNKAVAKKDRWIILIVHTDCSTE